VTRSVGVCREGVDLGWYIRAGTGQDGRLLHDGESSARLLTQAHVSK